MSKVIVTVEEFKTLYPEFEDNENVNRFLNKSICYFGLDNNEWLKDCQRKNALYLLTAHFLVLKTLIDNGDLTLNQKTSSSIGSVSVSLAVPTNKDAFEYWLNLTNYGKELLALLDMLKPNFAYFNGSFQRVLG